jgi:hypothetical protein
MRWQADLVEVGPNPRQARRLALPRPRPLNYGHAFRGAKRTYWHQDHVPLRSSWRCPGSWSSSVNETVRPLSLGDLLRGSDAHHDLGGIRCYSDAGRVGDAAAWAAAKNA